MINAGTVGAYLDLDISRFRDNLMIAANMLKQFRTEQESSFHGESPGQMMLETLSTPIIAAGKAASGFAGVFGRAMSDVRDDARVTGGVIGGIGTGLIRVSDSASDMRSGIRAVLDKIPSDAKRAIQESCSGMNKELSGGGRVLSSTAVKDGNGIVKAFEKTVGSGRLAAVGSSAVLSLAKGIDSRKLIAIAAINGIMRGMLSSAGSVKFTSVGTGVISGITKGLNSGKPGLLTAAASIASGIAARMKSVLKISSPSKVTQEIGLFTARGMEIGMKQGAQSLYDTSAAISMETAAELSGISSGRVGFSATRSSNYSDKLDRLLNAVEKLADSQTTMEIDGRPFGRLVREYV